MKKEINLHRIPKQEYSKPTVTIITVKLEHMIALSGGPINIDSGVIVPPEESDARLIDILGESPESLLGDPL